MTLKQSSRIHLLCALSLLCIAITVPSQQPSSAGDSLSEVTPGPHAQIPVADSVRVPILDFKNTDIRDVLRALGMQYNINIYLEPTVTGQISLYLVDIPVANAIDFVVRRNNYAYRVENGIVRVYKEKELPPPPPPPPPAAVFYLHGGVVDIDIKERTAGEVARLFVDSAGINAVIEGDHSKLVSAHLKGLAPARALKVLFESNGFEVSSSDGVYYVAQKSWGEEDRSGHNRELRRLSIAVDSLQRVTLEVDNASLDQMVRTIAIQSGINIFIYDNLSGAITAKCTAVPLDDALRFLLLNTQYTFWKDKSIYFIGSREMSQQKTSLIIPLRHIMADEAGISKKLPPGMLKDAVINYDSEHNALIAIGSYDVVARVQEFIDKIDRPIPQVLIEALVVDFNINKIREFGLSVFTSGPGDSAGGYPSESFLPTLNLKPGQKRTAQILKQVLRMLSIDRVITLPTNFRASINALETADVIKVHSTPQIATINGNPASITIGETRYYKLLKETMAPTTGNANTIVGTDERFEQKKFDTRLEVTPWVMDSGVVMVKIRPEFNIPRTGGDQDRPPTIDTRVLESMVRLRNGQTIVLGGQRQTERVVNSRGIPFLGSIPVLGWLFSNKTYSKNETQMMIFVTPRVYYGDEGGVKPDDYFGDEINRILDKMDPDKDKDERRKERKQRRHHKRSLRKRGAAESA